MTTVEKSGTAAKIAAERAAVEADIAGATLLAAYAETVEGNGDVEAHRWLDDGQWRSLTYREVYEQVRDLALGLREIGFAPGEFAVIWSRNRSEATIADYGVMHARGVPVFIYTTISVEQAAYIAGHCEATVAIVEPEFLPALLSVRDRLPKLRTIIVIEGEAPGVRPWSEVLDLGRAEAARSPELFAQTWRQVTLDDLVTLIYTSGTTGQPKAVMLTHRNTRYYQRALLRVIPLEEQVEPDGTSMEISYLPMAHAGCRILNHWQAMALPLTNVYCPDSSRLFEIAAQARPTTMVGVPRVWEKLHAALRDALPDVSPEAIRALPPQARTAALARVGLQRCRFAATAAAPLDPAIIEFFRALGLPLTEGWGMTELSGVATVSAPGDLRIGTVGRRIPGMEIAIAGDGEVLARGPLVMRGYYKDPERTAEAVDADGWLHTGDIGTLDDDGFLTITDRKKELIITSAGKNIPPALIEYQLQRHPLIGQACAVGDRRDYVTALIVLDPETAPAWAKAHGLPELPLAGLAAHPDVLAEVQRGVDEANSHLDREDSRVRRFLVLPDEWTTETGELTPTMKRRRQVIVERYAKEIDQLYVNEIDQLYARIALGVRRAATDADAQG